MTDLSLDVLLLLVVAGFGAGFIDSIAGGGGLITVPALLLAGLAPVDALGTNKLQSLFGSASATLAYTAKGQVSPREQVWPALLSFLGSLGGALVAIVLPGEVLRAALPFLLIAIALYFALKPGLDQVDRARKMPPALFALTLVPLVGFYDGLFGPGTGSFFMLGFVALAGFNLLKATAHTKLLNFASNFGGFAVFAWAGAVLWLAGLLMGLAQFAGAQVGARLAVRRGAGLIRPLLVLTCAALALRLLIDPAHPVGAWIRS
ncbi:MAG TPA: TSUP family transporter [Mesorhizobium sp.]|nr:TSUP family transporter [Mesorhizobium sp.]